MTRAITIVSKKAGFRRGGIAHPDEAKTYPAGTFTDEQIEAFKKEPTLVVTEAQAAPDEGNEPAKPKEPAKANKPAAGAAKGSGTGKAADKKPAAKTTTAESGTESGGK